MSTDELLNTGLALGMQVLELVHGRELLYVEAIWSDDVYVKMSGQHLPRPALPPASCLQPCVSPGFLLSRNSASMAVIWDTVVKMWAQQAAALSRQYRWYICLSPASLSMLNYERSKECLGSRCGRRQGQVTALSLPFPFPHSSPLPCPYNKPQPSPPASNPHVT